MTKSIRLFAFLLLTIGVTVSTLPGQESADQTTRRVLSAIENNHPEVVWQSLPASYQKDVEGLLAQFAGHVDPAIWSRIGGIMGKLSRLLDAKRDYVLAQPMVNAHMEQANADATAYQSLVNILRIVSESSMWRTDELATFDVEQFLSRTVGQITAEMQALSKLVPMGEEMPRLTGTQITLVSSEGDTAVVAIEDGDSTEEREFRRVEGKWIPSEMADEWPATIEEARQSLAMVPAQDDPETSQQIQFMFGTVEEWLDTLMQTESEEQFNEALEGIIGQAMLQFAGAMGGEEPEKEPRR